MALQNRALDVLCSGWEPSRPKPPTSSGVASVAGIARFLRPLDSTVLCSVMRAMMSSVMPAFACAQGRGCQQAFQLSGTSVGQLGVGFM